MKLFLHWLRWDLRRFRWPLLAWTALLAGFAAYLGHLHANLFTVNPRLFKYNEVIASVLCIVEVFIVLRLFTSDPAAGAQPFWKTRPPSGFAVAGAKLTLAVFFFLALPLLSWWVVVQASGFGPDESPRFGLVYRRITWMEMLWWTHALLLAGLALAASAARGAGHAVARLLAGAGVLVVPVCIIMLMAGLKGIVPGTPAAMWLGRHAQSIGEGLSSTLAPALWLLAAGAVFFLARRQRTCGPRVQTAHLVLPAVALVAGGAVLPFTSQPRQEFTPALDPAVATQIKIGQPLLRSGFFAQDGWYRRHLTCATRLHLAGLPEDRLLAAAWKSLRLTAPSGASATLAQSSMFFGNTYPGQVEKTFLEIPGAAFPKDELTPLSLTPCRGEGVVRVLVQRRQRKLVPLHAGATIETPGMFSQVMSLTPGTPPPGWPHELGSLSGQPWLEISSAISASAPAATFLLTRTDGPGRLDFEGNGRNAASGYFLLRDRRDTELRPAYRTPDLVRARFRREADENRTAAWRLEAEWYENEGWMEVPVTLEQVVIPRMPGDERKAVDLVDQLTLPPGATAEEVRWRVKYALTLIEASGGNLVQPLENDPLIQAVSRFLAKVPPERRDVLLRIVEEEPHALSNHIQPFDEPLRRRCAELLTAEDIPALRQKPRLFQDLRFALLARKLISYSEAHGPDWKDMTDEALHRNWQASYTGQVIYDEALKHAAPRGLPWVPAAVAEIADLLPHTNEAREAVKYVAPLSECPADPATGIPWLRENAARLTWDAAARRWVLP
jgi:hypothetical protein